MIIGHEITHGFDDEGSKYNAYGNLENWWSPSDLVQYEKIKTMVIHQYNQYEIDGNKVNGQLTIGENIADIGGLLLSFRAFKKYNQCHQHKVKINYDNLLSPEHMFFINFANIWKTKERPEEIKAKILLDVHSPPIFRVNGTLRNIDDFYEVFNIKPTDKLYLKPEQRVKIWG
jgi:putative endopeptidase